MRSLRKKMIVGTALFTVFLLGSCDFPYQPTQFVAPKPLYTFISAGDIRAFVGTSNVKIAFNRKTDGCIYYIDFNATQPAVIQLPNATGASGQADSPIFSPDGGWIAFYRYNGPTNCQSFIQKVDSNSAAVQVGGAFAVDPHWWVDTTDSKTYLIYSDKFDVDKDQLPALPGYHTIRQEVALSGSQAQLIGTPDTIADKPMAGGLSLNGKYLCTGYSDAALYEVDSQKVIPVNAGVQVCNPSISNDPAHPDWMMFLCFSGPQNMNFSLVGGTQPAPIRQHQYIFIVDQGNVVHHMFDRPFLPSANPSSQDSLKCEWQDPEWSNRADFAATLLGRSGESKYEGAILKISNGQTLNFLSSESIDKMDNTSTPYIWIGQ